MIQSAFGMMILRHSLRHSDGCLIETQIWSSEKKICARVTDFGIIAAAKLLQSCPTLCDPRDGSPPDSPVPGIL